LNHSTTRSVDLDDRSSNNLTKPCYFKTTPPYKTTLKTKAHCSCFQTN